MSAKYTGPEATFTFEEPTPTGLRHLHWVLRGGNQHYGWMVFLKGRSRLCGTPRCRKVYIAVGLELSPEEREAYRLRLAQQLESGQLRVEAEEEPPDIPFPQEPYYTQRYPHTYPPRRTEREEDPSSVRRPQEAGECPVHRQGTCTPRCIYRSGRRRRRDEPSFGDP